MRTLAPTLIGLAVLLVPAGCSSSNSEKSNAPSGGTPTTPTTGGTGKATNVILIIPDGSQVAHEIVASRYLNGLSFGLQHHHWPYSGFVTTWDVSTYDTFATSPAITGTGLPQVTFLDDDFFARTGYLPEKAGLLPYPFNAGYADTSDLDYLLTSTGKSATDSASAATAFASGWKTDDGNINWRRGDPIGGELVNICDLARAVHLPVGVVSTVEFTHATPAAMLAHNVSRNNYTAMATEMLATLKPEVIIGAGHRTAGGNYISQADQDAAKAPADGVYDYYRFVERDFSDAPPQTGDQRLMAAADAVVAATTAATSRSAGDGTRLFGLFGGPGGYFEHPVPAHAPGAPAFTVNTRNPGLGTCMEAAVKVLHQHSVARGNSGFFLMVEGGDIDWANHADDTAWMIGAWKQTDDAAAKIMAMIDDPAYPQLRSDNTLVLMVSDHGNSAMRIRRLTGKGHVPSQADFQRGVDSWAVAPETTASTLALADCRFDGADPDIVYPDYVNGSEFGGHTNELVVVSAMGDPKGIALLRGYEGFWQPDLLDNTFIFFVMAGYLGLEPPYLPMLPMPEPSGG